MIWIVCVSLRIIDMISVYDQDRVDQTLWLAWVALSLINSSILSFQDITNALAVIINNSVTLKYFP